MTEPIFYAAVLGSPIAHSKSPAIHQAAYQYLAAPIRYERFELKQQQVNTFITTLSQRYGSTKHLAGFSVTMPLKGCLVPYMQYLSSRVARLGVLNTVVFDSEGIAHGYNTDVDGIRHALSTANLTSSAVGSMGILGAGGTASAAIAAAADMGLSEVVLYVRNPDRAKDNLTVAKQYGLEARLRNLTEFPQNVQTHRAVVSTLPAFAADWLVEQLPTRELPPLLDVIYEPWPTALASAWQTAGAHVASGLDMLLYQGVEQVKLFTKKVLEQHTHNDWAIVTDQMATALGIARKV